MRACVCLPTENRCMCIPEQGDIFPTDGIEGGGDLWAEYWEPN